MFCRARSHCGTHRASPAPLPSYGEGGLERGGDCMEGFFGGGVEGIVRGGLSEGFVGGGFGGGVGGGLSWGV